MNVGQDKRLGFLQHFACEVHTRALTLSLESERNNFTKVYTTYHLLPAVKKLVVSVQTCPNCLESPTYSPIVGLSRQFHHPLIRRWEVSQWCLDVREVSVTDCGISLCQNGHALERRCYS